MLQYFDMLLRGSRPKYFDLRPKVKAIESLSPGRINPYLQFIWTIASLLSVLMEAILCNALYTK